MHLYIYENQIFKNFLINDLNTINAHLFQNRGLIMAELGIEIFKDNKNNITFSRDLDECDEEKFHDVIENFELDMKGHNFFYEVKLFMLNLKTDTSQKIFFNDILTCSYDTLGLLEYYISEFNEQELLNIQKSTFSITYDVVRFYLLSLLRDYNFIFKEIILDFINTSNQHDLYLLEPIIKSQNVKTPEREKYKWFEVGLKFADGTIYKLVDKNMSYNQISKIIFNSNSNRPYISESFSVNSDSNKNIFNDFDKILKIAEYCEANKIPIHPRFTDRYMNLRDKQI